ncbi:superoxide dismutase [Clostridium beijerinckii]|jgi:Superoxide dismutase|uniref:Superoxide dismutase n=1 Tax=Clostridium beijerinckii TaxID=1520 RepID=A0AAW3W4F2_CLOBE|nr:superoxide dismutase [Clostridium beijerinckii]MBC2456457.1 superoxide dismutase [Clostridium beijerinckii]MBC2473757.1 superoxide dismutase [Clostridium beijerinckii]NOV59335.1 Fe-Mn family superoxide dismutase [Clostridium beijerinckii]NOV72490.1 Fe-Mn family superoxide dismutase [Clostridium beijerinckii]NOW34811.1 Fe-Mn family superoxide dismutase [Clostridium beijerinckii]
MRYEKIELTYSYNSLEPYIDEETVKIHYTKHLQGYVDKLNNVIKGYEKFTEGKTLEQILSNPNKIPKKIYRDVINQGGGVLNHNLYFSILFPYPKKEPEGKLLNEIVSTFGSLEMLKKLVSETAINKFGSGYGWLVKDKRGKLKVANSSNQDTPLSFGFTPILTIDVWEHSYYLKYKNLRGDYVKNIWNLIDWARVEELYKNDNLV